MKWSAVVLGAAVVASLACSGATDALPELSGPQAGAYTQSLAKFAVDEWGPPCETSVIGEEITLGDWTLLFEPTQLVEVENKLPWINNMQERGMLKDPSTKGLVVRYKVRNNRPVKTEYDVYMRARSTDGETLWGASLNQKYLLERLNMKRIWDQGELTPGKWYDGVQLFAINPEFADGAAIVLYQEEKQRDPTDPRGRFIDVVVTQHAVDLGTPTTGESLKRSQ